MQRVLHVALNANAHLHPQSQGLQIYSLHHQCQGSSWSQKRRRRRCMELRHRGSSYRKTWGGQLLAPDGCLPAGSHNIQCVPSSGARFYLHKNIQRHVHTICGSLFCASGKQLKFAICCEMNSLCVNLTTSKNGTLKKKKEKKNLFIALAT